MQTQKFNHGKQLYRGNYCGHEESIKAYLYADTFSNKGDIGKNHYHTKNQHSTPNSLYGGFVVEFPIDPMEKEFSALSLKWQSETGGYSTSLQKVNDTYLEIISKGEKILPYILRDIQLGGSVHWHIALKAITGENPVPFEKMNKSKEVKESWILWGKNHNYLS